MIIVIIDEISVDLGAMHDPSPEYGLCDPIHTSDTLCHGVGEARASMWLETREEGFTTTQG